MSRIEFGKPQGYVPASRPGSMTLLLTSVFFERMSFYGWRSVMFTLVSGIGMGELGIYSLYGLQSRMLFLMAVVFGLLVDTVLDKRLSIVAGIFLNAAGILLFLTGDPTLLGVGLSMMAVGSGATKVGYLSYHGHLLPKAANGVDGGYAIFYGVVSFGAFAGIMLVGALGDAYGMEALTLLFGCFGLAHAVGMGIMMAVGSLPPERELTGKPAMSMGRHLAGTAVIGLLVAVGTGMLLLGTAGPGGWMGMSLQLIQFLLMVVSFVLLAIEPGEGAARRNGIVALGVVLAILFWAVYDIVGHLQQALFGRGGSDWLMQEGNTLAVTVLAVVLGAVIYSNSWGDARGFKSAGLRVLLAVGILVFAGIAVMAMGSVGGSMLGPLVLLFPLALAEVFMQMTVYGGFWRLASDGSKGKVLGMVLGATSLGSALGNAFTGAGAAGTDMLFPAMGIGLLSLLAIAAALGLYFLMRNHQGGGSLAADANPFDL